MLTLPTAEAEVHRLETQNAVIGLTSEGHKATNGDSLLELASKHVSTNQTHSDGDS